jgi:hypothetical protein
LDRAQIIPQIAEVARRLTELSSEHRVLQWPASRLAVPDLAKTTRDSPADSALAYKRFQ